MADFGTDISCLPDLDTMGSLKSGNYVLAEAIARRLITQRGTLVDSLNYGDDQRRWLGEAVTAQTLTQCKSAVEAECRADERVLSADATLSFDAPSNTLNVGLILGTSGGPFRFVLAITSVTIQVVQFSG